MYIYRSSVQWYSRVWLFATPWTTAYQTSLSITNSRSLPKLMSIESVMPSNHLILCRPLLLPSIFPNIKVFSNESALCISGQNIGVSASTSVLPMNTQDWSPSEWTGWISLQSKGCSRVFSNTTVQKRQFFGTQLSLWSNSHIHTWLLEKPQPWLDALFSQFWTNLLFHVGEDDGTTFQYSCLENPMEEPGGLQSMGLLRVGHDWATLLSLFTFMHWRRKWQPTPVFLPGESQGQRSLVGCRLWGRTESDTTAAT